MAFFREYIDGFRLTPELRPEVERMLAPLARLGAERVVVGMEANGPTVGFEGMYEMGLQISRDLARDGGRVDWDTWTVTGLDGIERSREGGIYQEPLYLPPLDDARAASLCVSWTSNSPVQPKIAMDIFETGCRLEIQAHPDEIVDLKVRVLEVLNQFVDPELLPTPPTFKVFIGHGGDPQWKYLYKTLNNIEGTRAEAFESAERAGFHTLVVVDQMVRSSSVAIVVMTGEDTDARGQLRARENVVHEVGFCQGALGVENTIVLLEEGVSEPSNIKGLTQIRFPRGALIDVEARILEVVEQRRQIFEYQQG